VVCCHGGMPSWCHGVVLRLYGGVSLVVAGVMLALSVHDHVKVALSWWCAPWWCTSWCHGVAVKVAWWCARLYCMYGVPRIRWSFKASGSFIYGRLTKVHCMPSWWCWRRVKVAWDHVKGKALI
jgi:hypothetical protein